MLGLEGAICGVIDRVTVGVTAMGEVKVGVRVWPSGGSGYIDG